jgi:ATP-dependent Clp protease ATP-binding subunit ClpA
MALLDPSADPAHAVLTAAGFTLDRVRADADRLVGQSPGALGDDDAQALRTIGIDLDAVVASVEQTFGPGALSGPEREQRRGFFGAGGPRFTKRSKKALELSLREALRLGDRHIGTGHILLGIIRGGDGLAAKILTDGGASLTDLRASLVTELGRAA